MIGSQTPLEWETPPTATEPETVALEPFATDTPKVNLSPEVTRDRATKAHIAAGEESPGIDGLIGQIQSGLEDDIRAKLVSDDYFKKQNQHQDLVAEYFATKGMQAEDPGEVAYVKQLSKAEPERLATIIEKKYASNRLDLALASDTSGAVERVDQEKLDGMHRMAAGRIIVKERAQRLKENLEARYDQAGWFRKTVDFSKGFIPLWNTYELATVAPEGVDSEGVLAKGDVMRQQYRDVFNMSPEQQDAWFAKMEADASADPSQLQYAIEFLSGLQSYTAVQASIDNFSNYVEGGLELTPLGMIGPLAKLGVKGAVKVGGKVATAKATQGAAKGAVPGVPGGGGSLKGAPAAGGASGATEKEAVAEAVFNAASGPKVVNQDGLVAAPVKVAGSTADEAVISVDVPNPKTGETAKVSVPDNDEAAVAAQINATTQDAMRQEIDEVETIAAHGDSDNAAVVEAVRQLEAGSKPVLPNDIAGLSKGLQRKLLSFFDPFTRVVGRTASKSHYKEILRRAEEFKAVIQAQKEIADTLLGAWKDARGGGVIRVSEESFEKMKPIMDAKFRKEFSSSSDGILDIENIRETDATGLRVNGRKFILGRPDKTYFQKPADARFYADSVYKIDKGYYSIEPRGSGGYVVSVTKLLDETDKSYASALINTKTKTPVTWASAITSYFKGGSATSSEWLATNLKVSAHHANALHKAFADVAKEIKLKTKDEIDGLNEILVTMRDAINTNPQTGEMTRGKWANDAVEFDRMYKTAFNKPATEAQQKAYFAIRSLHDFDMITRNMNLYTDLGRMGVEEFKVYLPIVADAIPEEGIEASTKWIQHQQTTLMRVVDELPKNQLDNDILILDAEGVTHHLISKARDGTAKIDEFLSKGYKILQIANPDQYPFKHINDNFVEFVIARDFERKPLSLDRLPYTEGGHVRTSESSFVKQPKFKTTSNSDRHYVGDETYAGFSTDAEAKVWYQNIEKGRQLFNAGDDAALEAHVLANTPHDLREFKNQFIEYVAPDGTVTPAKFDKDVPFAWVTDGQGVNDAAKSHMPELRSHFEGVKDTIDNGNNLFRLLGKKYTGSKDQMLRTVVQGENNRAWKFEDARHVSPLALLEEAASELSRTLSLNDLKHSAAMHWVEEAAPLLDTPLEELRSDPWSHFYNPQWKGQYTDVAVKRALDASRENVLGYMGLAKSKSESTVDWVKTKVMNSVFEKFGGEKADWVDDNLLPNIPDPIRFMRHFAFQTKMGFLNPVQPFVQGQTFFHTMAVTGSPKRAGSALAGLMGSTAGRHTTQRSVLLGIDKKMQKLGWKSGEWLESHDILRKLKLDVVEGEAGILDMETAPKMFQSKGGAFLDKGLILYRGIERGIRINAWHVAYKEFRDKFPTKVIGNLEENEILLRQEILSVNMTRSGNAQWQRGLLAPATQFMGYQARIMEQLLGHQLTRAEKLRVGVTYGALYGMPVSLGAATFMQIPGASSDDIRQYAQDNGIDVNSGITGVAMNGAAAMFVQWMTSDENGENGYLFNVGERVGPAGSRLLKELINGDKTIFDAYFGASGAILVDAVKAVYPEDGDVIAAMANAPGKSISEYANVFSTISTVNNSTKLLWALFTHRNMSRNGVDFGAIDNTSAVIRFLTGLEEQRFQDDGLKMKSLAEFTDYKKEIAKEYKAQYKRMMGFAIGSEERDTAIKRMRALLEGVDADTRQSITWQARQPDKPRDESLAKSHSKKFPKSEGNN